MREKVTTITTMTCMADPSPRDASTGTYASHPARQRANQQAREESRNRWNTEGGRHTPRVCSAVVWCGVVCSVCVGCGVVGHSHELGHLGRQCPQPKITLCYNCMEEGHISSEWYPLCTHSQAWTVRQQTLSVLFVCAVWTSCVQRRGEALPQVQHARPSCQGLLSVLRPRAGARQAHHRRQ